MWKLLDRGVFDVIKIIYINCYWCGFFKRIRCLVFIVEGVIFFVYGIKRN